jgi:hypothetical protein
LDTALRDAIRELKRNPALPIRVFVDGLMVEIRAVGARGSGSSPSPAALAAGASCESPGAVRAALLMGAARAATRGRIAHA